MALTKATEDAAERLQEQIAELREQMAELGRATGHRLSAGAKSARHLVDEATERASENPLAATGIAMGVGFLLGALFFGSMGHRR